LKHQPAEGKRIVLRALYRFKITRMRNELSQDFERDARFPRPSCKSARRNPRPIAGVAVTVPPANGGIRVAVVFPLQVPQRPVQRITDPPP
jgi:hypothetical protein